MIKLFYITIPLTFISFLIIAEPARAATEFISTIKQSGGNYSTLASWEAAIQSDLTASTTAVYSGTGTGSLSQGNILELFRGGTYQNATSTVIATTSSQILVQNYYNSGAPITLQSGDEWRKASSTANMFTVSGSGVQLGDTAIATAQIDGAWTSADTTAVTIDGWTTDATRYIRVYTTTAARHTGKWDTNKYRLEVSGDILGISEDFVRIEGVQFQLTNAFSSRTGLSISGQNAGSKVYINNNIIKGVLSGASGHTALNLASSNVTFYVYNNLIYDFNINSSVSVSINNGEGTHYIYNNSINNCIIGITKLAGNTTVAKNNLLSSCTTPASGTFSVGTDYNATNNASMGYTVTGGGNTHDIVGQTFAFVDATNKDFHLSSSDTSAKDAGTNLSADANLAFSDDIDGNTRPVGNAWDIGADETYGVIIIIE